MVPRAHPSPQPKRQLDRRSRFVGLTSVTDRPTDHASRSVRIGRIYVRSTAMRPNNQNVSVIFHFKSDYSRSVHELQSRREHAEDASTQQLELGPETVVINAPYIVQFGYCSRVQITATANFLW